jgi:uncharacterized membrane protein YphA (DoxX/SURF4 family)
MSVIALTNATIRRSTVFGIFTIVVRLLLAFAFIPSGLVKLLGNRFTVLGPESPIGYFFDALYQTGVYYRFIGGAQLLAALLLLLPATATLGALVYFAIVLNIFIITISLPFSGTPVITCLMLLGCLWLIWWDFEKWRALIPGLLLPKRLAARIVLSGMIIGALAGTASFALLAALKISGFASLGWTGVLTFFTGGAVLGLIGAFHFAHGRHDNHA